MLVLIFRCASISWFQVVSGWVSDKYFSDLRLAHLWVDFRFFHLKAVLQNEKHVFCRCLGSRRAKVEPEVEFPLHKLPIQPPDLFLIGLISRYGTLLELLEKPSRTNIKHKKRKTFCCFVWRIIECIQIAGFLLFVFCLVALKNGLPNKKIR